MEDRYFYCRFVHERFVFIVDFNHRYLIVPGTRAVKTGQAVRAGPFSTINFRAWALNIEPEF